MRVLKNRSLPERLRESFRDDLRDGPREAQCQ